MTNYRWKKDFGFLMYLTFDLSVGNMTLTTPPQWKIYRTLANMYGTDTIG